MKPNARALLLGTEKLPVEWGGMTINLECQPRAYNGTLEKEVQNASTNSEGLALLVSRLVVGWDLLEDDAPDAKPYPLTVAALSELPMQFLSAVADALTGVLDPNSPTRKTSSSST